MDIKNIISLLGGLGLFLFGMRLMGDGLKSAAGSKLKHTLSLMTKNRFIAMITGVFVTAVIQSSGATTVMVVGFVNAQMLTLAQSVGVILGANIGTTMTSLLLSIKFDPGAVFAFIGILMVMLARKREAIKQVGYVFMGLGVLFVGMKAMSSAMEPLGSLPAVQELMQGVKNPLLGVVVGMVITALLQSSSVSVGIIQMMVAANVVSLEGAMYLVLGAQIGACTPTLLAMANSTVSAKRAAMVHLIFNILKTGIILVLTLFFPLAQWFEAFVPNNPKFCISCMHIGFNVCAVLLVLPCSNVLEKLSRFVIRGEDAPTKDIKMQYYDARLLKTPALAAEQLYREVCRMGRQAHTHITLALDALKNMDQTHEEEILYHEDLSDYLEEAITEGLVATMHLKLSEQDSKKIAALFHIVTDIERISDHADNLYGLAKERIAREAKFSDKALDEMIELNNRVTRVLNSSLQGLEEWCISDGVMQLLEDEEQNVDDMTDALRRKHIERLKEHKCTPKSGVIFLESINNLERVADHSINIAVSVREESFHNRPAPTLLG